MGRGARLAGEPQNLRQRVDTGNALRLRADVLAHATQMLLVDLGEIATGAERPERADQPFRRRVRHTARGEVLADAVRADLVALVQRHERLIMKGGGHAEVVEHPAQNPAMIQPQEELRESQLAQDVAHRGAQLHLDHGRRRADHVDVTLIELTESATGGTVRAPHRLNLVPLEELRQPATVLGDHARERDGEVVAQCEVRLPSVLAAAQHFENQLVALVAVFARQRFDVLERGRLERLEAVALVHAAHHVDDVLTTAHVLGKEVAHAARGLRVRGHQLSAAM